MADIPDRDKLEKQYARLLSKLLSAYGGRLLEKLGDPPNLDNLPPDFWDKEAEELRGALAPFGERVYLDAAQRMLTEGVAVGVDWSLVNQAAVDWASRYTYELVSSMRDGDQALLRKVIAAYFEQGQTIGQLEERIMRQFGPVRAEMIAVTEITRAASEGEQQIAKELAAQGITMIPIWQTNNDDLVCPLCGPRHNKPRSEWPTEDYPPLHPRCRCWIDHRLP